MPGLVSTHTCLTCGTSGLIAARIFVLGSRCELAFSAWAADEPGPKPRLKAVAVAAKMLAVTVAAPAVGAKRFLDPTPPPRSGS